MLGGLIYIEPKEPASFETAEALLNLLIANRAPLEGSYYGRVGRIYRVFSTPGKAKIYFDRIKRTAPLSCVTIYQDKEQVAIYVNYDSHDDYNVKFDVRSIKNYSKQLLS